MYLICFIYLVTPDNGTELTTPSPIANCEPSCGSNAICKENNGIGSCFCENGFFGNAKYGCSPECTINGQCQSDKACFDKKCIDPCKGTCGIGSLCEVKNHKPICSCPKEMFGDPFTQCRESDTQPDGT